MRGHFNTIKRPSEAIHKAKGSKFLAFSYPVENLSQIDEHLKFLKKKYHDASHHCYAYRLQPDGSISKANDDGEPSHSAGDPILGQIRSFNLSNVLIVVMRYFGGTKLGIGGLVNAYKTAANLVIENSTIIKITQLGKIRVTYSYENTTPVMAFLNKSAITIIDQDFSEQCVIIFEIEKSHEPGILKNLEIYKVKDLLIDFEVL